MSEVTGLREALAALDQLGRAVRGRILRKVITEESRRTLRPAKATAPRKKGWLKKAMGYRVKTYVRSGSTVGIVGARSGFRSAGRGKQRRRTQTSLGKQLTAAGVSPTRYIHLAGPRRRQRFMTQAEQFAQAGAEQRMAARIWELIDQELRRAR